MKAISNEEKATEIAIQRKKHYFDADALIINSEVECYASAIDMANWKDEQHEQEKQQLIDKACEWLAVNDSYAKPTHLQVDRLREHLNNLK